MADANDAGPLCDWLCERDSLAEQVLMRLRANGAKKEKA